jgi:cell division protein FtsN
MKKRRQRGNLAIGLIVGIVLGLGVALGIAVYVTKVPIPFVTKMQRGSADQDQAEARRNKDWDPNAPLAGKAGTRPAAPPAPAPAPSATPPEAAAGPATSEIAPLPNAPVPLVIAPPASRTAKPAPLPPPSDDPIGDIARAKSGMGTDPFIYFVQAGAFRTSADAEAQRAKLSLMGVESKVTEREQSGRTVFRVRAGPFANRDAADSLNDRLKNSGMDAALVRVQR